MAADSWSEVGIARHVAVAAGGKKYHQHVRKFPYVICSFYLTSESLNEMRRCIHCESSLKLGGGDDLKNVPCFVGDYWRALEP
jgi:hypothetical protein